MKAMDRERRRVLGLAAGGMVAGVAMLRTVGAATPKVITIVARRYTYSPDKITLTRGVPVVLELRSADVLMGFSAPDFNVRADIIPGQVARVNIVPAKTGAFPFLCDIFCGSGHETMGGTITVVA